MTDPVSKQPEQMRQLSAEEREGLGEGLFERHGDEAPADGGVAREAMRPPHRPPVHPPPVPVRTAPSPAARSPPR